MRHSLLILNKHTAEEFLTKKVLKWVDFVKTSTIEVVILSQTCSKNIYNNLLVEANTLYHLRGFILCNEKRLTFNKNKKQEHRGTVQKVFYFPMSYFFLIDGVVGSVCVIKKFPHCDVSIVIFDGCWIKIIFYKN